MRTMPPRTHFKLGACQPPHDHWKAMARVRREWHNDEVFIITSSPVCRAQSSFYFSVLLDSLFGCLLFTYRLRRRRIPVACLLTRTMLLEYQWVKKSVTLFTGMMEEAAHFLQHLWKASSLALHRPGKL